MADRNAKIIKLKLDIIFKRVFGDSKDEDVIAAFVSSMLDIPRESIDEIHIDNVELPPEYMQGKFSRLDLKMRIDGRMVNIEMQINSEPDYRDRTLYYWSKMYSGELSEGDEYGELKQTICINIINFNLFDCEDYHSHFQILERNRQEVLTDKFAIHFFELKKVNKARKNKSVEDWLDLINAETEGELMDLETKTTIPEIHKVIVKLRNLSADENARRIAEYRERQMHDEASAIKGSRREGYNEGIQVGMQKGMQQGIQKGMQKGIQKGMQQGIEHGRNEIIFRMRKSGMTEEQIKTVLELP